MQTVFVILCLFLMVFRLIPTQELVRRIRAWMEETHGVRFELHRHFFFRIFDSEFVTSPEQWRVVAGGALGILISLGLIFTPAYYHKYLALLSLDDPQPYRLALLADVVFVIALVMVVVALFTTVEWPSLFPGLRDYLALAGLPLRPGDVFFAKFNSLFFAATLVTVAVALLPSLILPAMASVPIVRVAGLFVSATLGGLLVFFTLVALQGLLLNVLPVRWFARVSLAAQGLLLSVFLCSLPLVFSLPNLANQMNLRPAWALWAPPVWFLGLDQRIAGDPDPLAALLARRGFAAVILAAACAGATYLWSYRRHRRRLLESPALESPAARSWVDALASRVIVSPRKLAVFSFTGKTLARSRQHRLVFTAFVGIALAVIFEAFVSLALRGGLAGLSQPSPARVQAAIGIPLALSLFVLAGFRYLFRLPAEIRANWVFRIHEPGHGSDLLKGVDRFLWSWAVMPVALAALPVEVLLLGWTAGLLVTAACALVSLLAAEIMLFNYERIPFTSSYLPGRRPLIETLLGYSVAAALYIGGLSLLLRLLVPRPGGMLALIGGLGALWWWLGRARQEWKPLGRLEFEELPESAVQLLGIEKD